MLFYVRVGGERAFLVDLEPHHTVAHVRHIAALRFPLLELSQILFQGAPLVDDDSLGASCPLSSRQ